MELLILFLPLIAAIISGFFSKLIGDRTCEIITSLFVSISAVLSIIIFYNVIFNDYLSDTIIASWINSGTIRVEEIHRLKG